MLFMYSSFSHCFLTVFFDNNIYYKEDILSNNIFLIVNLAFMGFKILKISKSLK